MESNGRNRVRSLAFLVSLFILFGTGSRPSLSKDPLNSLRLARSLSKDYLEAKGARGVLKFVCPAPRQQPCSPSCDLVLYWRSANICHHVRVLVSIVSSS